MNSSGSIRLLKSLLLILCCTLSASCWPMRFVTSPGAKGVVVDGRSHRPMPNVEVFVSRIGFRPCEVKNPATGRLEPVYGGYDTFVPPSVNSALDGARAPTTVTDVNGQFIISPETIWGIYIVPMDIFPATGSLLLRRDGRTQIVKHLVSNSSVNDVGEVRWHRE